MTEKSIKHSYTVPCSSAFRDAVEVLARRRGVNAADLARSVVLLLPAETIAAHPDPGEPPAGDRETVILKSGAAEGRPWRRKPRLQVRMTPGLDVPTIRRALALALAMDRGDLGVHVGTAPLVAVEEEPEESAADLIHEIHEELDRLRTIVSVLSFEPLADGVRSRDDALHVLGFPPGRVPERRAIQARYRMLATIHHPDGRYGSHNRMSQLNEAMDLLRRSML